MSCIGQTVNPILAPSRNIEFSEIDEATESGMDTVSCKLAETMRKPIPIESLKLDFGSRLYATNSDSDFENVLGSLKDIASKKGLLPPVPEDGITSEELKTRLASLAMLDEYRREHHERLFGRITNLLMDLLAKMNTN